MNRSRFRTIKAVLLIVGLLIFVTTGAVGQTQTPLQLVRKVQSLYMKRLSPLDRDNLIRGQIKVRFENSGADGESPYTTKYFRSFAALEKWMKRSEGYQPGLPYRATGEKPTCSRGRCVMYMQGGTLHNHVYLEKLFYGYSRGKIYIKTLHIMYG